MSNKVYCSQCAYFISTYTTTAECSYTDNVMLELRDDWYSKREDPNYIRKPYDINKDGDCTWFKLITKTKDKGFFNYQ